MGSINFSGDTAIILACDGPSLGGFVSPATIVSAELWKVGQVKSGDKIRFTQVTREWAADRERDIANKIQELGTSGVFEWPMGVSCSVEITQANEAILFEDHTLNPSVVYRQAGDNNILIEYGEAVLDFASRLRVH